MLRSAQTLLAQALLLQTFGRDWTLEEITSSQSMIEKYINIMTAFLDHDDPKCPFSIHRIAGASARVDVEVGQWFGPTSIAQVLKYGSYIVDLCAKKTSNIFIPIIKIYCGETSYFWITDTRCSRRSGV
ncbi:hypothetical protein BKA69DRAFT_1053776 [Paraphysoderma sedebokerense]|nr:hypothetical protein BKA69DRAFT_1053776 [Paraphysoderma sedebokerense]